MEMPVATPIAKVAAKIFFHISEVALSIARPVL